MLFLCRAQEFAIDNNKPDNKKHSSSDYSAYTPVANASGWICTDTSANSQLREVATTTKVDGVYSEVPPSSKQKKRASTISGDLKADNTYSEHKSTGASTKGYIRLLLAGGQGNKTALSQETLYDQPVSLTALCWDNTFQMTNNLLIDKILIITIRDLYSFYLRLL